MKKKCHFHLINVPSCKIWKENGTESLLKSFEDRLKAFVGADHVVCVNSDTSAIHLALRALGVGPGDWVLVPTFTYIATILSHTYGGRAKMDELMAIANEASLPILEDATESLGVLFRESLP